MNSFEVQSNQSAFASRLSILALFVASLAVTVAVAGVPSVMLLGGDLGMATLLRTAAVVAPLYFLVNTALVAGAIALSTRQPAVAAWRRNFLWSAPSYLTGGALAAIATMASERGWFGWLAMWCTQWPTSASGSVM